VSARCSQNSLVDYSVECRQHGYAATSVHYVVFVVTDCPRAKAIAGEGHDVRHDTFVVRGCNIVSPTKILNGFELESMCGSLISCTDVNDGVLFLCGDECLLAIADDIVTAMRGVQQEVSLGFKHSLPRNPIIARSMKELLDQITGKQYNEVPQQPDGAVSMRYNVISPEQRLDNAWKRCKICGVVQPTLESSAGIALSVLACDLQETKLHLRPSAFLRLFHTLRRYAHMTACSKKCIRMIVRYGALGHGRVHVERTAYNDNFISSLNVALDTLPHASFAVVHFEDMHVLNHGEEDTTCAVTVASLMSDIEGMPMDPYMIFAAGRSLQRLSTNVFGMALRDACLAVVTWGCVLQDMSPFRFANRPNRKQYVDWAAWKYVTNTDDLRRHAYARRRQAVFVVDGPHGNAFDNVRAALWAFREQRRGFVAALKFSMEWLKSDSGLISETRAKVALSRR